MHTCKFQYVCQEKYVYSTCMFDKIVEVKTASVKKKREILSQTYVAAT